MMMVNIINENSGKDERYKNTLDKYKKVLFTYSINISLGTMVYNYLYIF